MSVMVSFCAVLFPTRVLDEILNLIESVSEGFLPTLVISTPSCELFLFPNIIIPLQKMWCKDI